MIFPTPEVGYYKHVNKQEYIYIRTPLIIEGNSYTGTDVVCIDVANLLIFSV